MNDLDAIRASFLDGVLADVDLSRWSERVDLLLVGAHLRSVTSGWSAVVVSLVGVRELHTTWRHDRDALHGQGLRWNTHDVVPSPPVAGGRHRWRIDGPLPSPLLVVEFDRAEATPVDDIQVRRTFPQVEPDGRDGFLRPGLLDALATRRPGTGPRG